MQQKRMYCAAPCVYKESENTYKWFIAKSEENGDWEIPKFFARGGESSVRAGIRGMGEQGGMKVKALEEAGRAGGATMVNGKTSPVRYLYYLMIAKDESGEPVGFVENSWLEYAKAVRKLSSKRDREMLKKARQTLRDLKKQGKLEELAG